MVMREDEKDAMQYDNAFSRLRYAELPEMALHPEMKGLDLIRVLAERIAAFSQASPGIVGGAIAALPRAAQMAFERYVEKYGVTFA
jgi:hypothetical protein